IAPGPHRRSCLHRYPCLTLPREATEYLRPSSDAYFLINSNTSGQSQPDMTSATTTSSLLSNSRQYASGCGVMSRSPSPNCRCLPVRVHIPTHIYCRFSHPRENVGRAREERCMDIQKNRRYIRTIPAMFGSPRPDWLALHEEEPIDPSL